MPEYRNALVGLRIASALAMSGVFVGLGILLYLAYLAGLPERPNPQTGHIVELRVHGTVLYTTELQQAIKGSRCR
jgi:hypothetical protein